MQAVRSSPSMEGSLAADVMSAVSGATAVMAGQIAAAGRLSTVAMLKASMAGSMEQAAASRQSVMIAMTAATAVIETTETTETIREIIAIIGWSVLTVWRKMIVTARTVAGAMSAMTALTVVAGTAATALAIMAAGTTVAKIIVAASLSSRHRRWRLPVQRISWWARPL